MLVIIAFFVLRTNAQALTVEHGDKYIYGFREDSHFALMLSYGSSDWKTMEDLFATGGVSLRFLYRFHLRLVGKLGYFLGTSFGLSYFFPQRYDKFYSLSLPGATAGLVWYVNPRWQVSLLGEANLERIPELPDGEENFLRDINLESFVVAAVIERFYSLTTAVTAAFGYNYVLHRALLKTRVAQVERSGLQFSAGVSYHFL